MYIDKVVLYRPSGCSVDRWISGSDLQPPSLPLPLPRTLGDFSPQRGGGRWEMGSQIIAQVTTPCLSCMYFTVLYCTLLHSTVLTPLYSTLLHKVSSRCPEKEQSRRP